ncbi:MAG: hypothetical protein ACYC6N_30890, partial [Pirellulaceae bacterium]
HMPSHRNVAETETHPVFVSRVAKQHEPLNGLIQPKFNGGPTLPRNLLLAEGERHRSLGLADRREAYPR